jgi:hypothetical protein
MENMTMGDLGDLYEIAVTYKINRGPFSKTIESTWVVGTNNATKLATALRNDVELKISEAINEMEALTDENLLSNVFGE